MRMLVPIVLSIALMSCAPAPPAEQGSAPLTPEDEAAIRGLVSGFDAAFMADDMAAVTALYADDYVEMRPTALEGRDRALEAYRRSTNTYSFVASTVRRIEGSGSLAYVWVEFEGRFSREDGSQRLQNGNTLWVARKGPDGTWRFAASGFQSASRADSTGA